MWQLKLGVSENQNPIRVRGVKYVDEVIRRKVGKKAVGAGS